MKAAYIERHGGPQVLQYGDLPDPAAGPGDVVVDIFAASVNGADWKVRSGDYKQSKFPYVLGRDFSGVISAVGEEVKDLRVGDAVFGVCEAGQEGAYAEKIAVKAAIVAKKPETLSHIDAAALALTGLTALSAVEDTLKLKSGETILIQGGAGGVAGFAIHLVTHIAARRFGRLRAGSNKGCAAARPEHRERGLRHVAADRIKDRVAVGNRLGKIAGVVIDDLIGAEAAHIVTVRRARRGDHAGADMLGELDGEAGDAARPALD